MESVWRAAVIYGVLLVLCRVSGKRSLARITAFDFVLLLIVGEATQQALLGDDFSITNPVVVIATLMGLELLLSVVKDRWPALDPLLDSRPLVIVTHGRLLVERARRERIDEGDVLAAARERHGLERLDQVTYAVLERSGGISIIPSESPR